MAEAQDESDLKIEANITLFGKEIVLKPMEGDEIGFRTPAGSPGVVISKEVLERNKFIPSTGIVKGIIPDTTDIRTVIYNKKTRKVELAVKADFKKDFVLNKFPDIFTLNSVYVYLNNTPENTPAPGTPVT